MTSTPWTAAPAGTLGLGGFAVRADGCFVGVSAFDKSVDMVATAGTAARVRPVAAHVVPAERQPRIAPTYFAQNDGTTLGIPSSRRPQS
jgi:hypothetical protein